MTRPLTKLTILFWSCIAGLAYGVATRFSLENHAIARWFGVMSLAFIFLLPFAIGFISVYLMERWEPQPVWMWILAPWIGVGGATLTAVAAYIEGAICVVMFLPIGLCLSSLGGLAAGLIARRHRLKHVRDVIAAGVLLLPFLVSPWESAVFARKDMRTVENAVTINAPPAAVWDQIKRVAPIQKPELLPSWSRRIGFPDPVEATLSFEGIGGIRHASFTGGVLFIETVDAWEPERHLAFSIRAQTAQIPRTTLDDHVVVGGPFFDVLHGEYSIEPLANGATRLHLASQHRLSTDFNWYAHFWTDAVMADLQKAILHVVQQRAEASAKKTAN